jgi:hypothetical protein
MKQFINCQLDPLGIGCGLRDRPACRLLASAETKPRALSVLSFSMKVNISVMEFMILRLVANSMFKHQNPRLQISIHPSVL